MSSLRCPNCDYDVRASLLWRNTVRCPECGVVVSLDALAAYLVGRRRKARSMWLEFAGAVFIMMIVLSGNIIHDAPPGVNLLRDRVVMVTAEPALLVTLVAIALMSWATCGSWRDLLSGHRVALLAVALLIILTLPSTIALILLLLNLLGLSLWWKRGGHGGAPNRRESVS